MGLVQKHKFMRIDTKSWFVQVFLMLTLPYTKSGVRLSKVGFLACPMRMVGQANLV